MWKKLVLQRGGESATSSRVRRCSRDGAVSASSSTAWSVPSVSECNAGTTVGRKLRRNLGISAARHPRQRGGTFSSRDCSNLVARCSGKDSIEDVDPTYETAGASSFRSRGDGTSSGSEASKSSSFANNNIERKPPQVRVRFKLQYRCHSRQMLAIAGSMSPLGWSFLSIARNPLVWKEGDWWTIELNFPEGARLEYKYVVLEDQNWTKQADEAAEGLVPLYRPSGEVITDTEAIVRKMAIVAWQPGPNLVFTVPSQDEAKASKETFEDEGGIEIPVAEQLDLWM